MKISVFRFAPGKNDTISAFGIDGKFQCLGLEDEMRTIKVFGETAVPDGIYKIGLRCEGGHFQRYRQKFPDIHKTDKHGMLCVYNEPGWKLVKAGMSFQYVLIHIGNSEDDTAACYLTNSNILNMETERRTGSGSTYAYKKIYPIIAEALLRGEDVEIEYKTILK